MSDPTKVSRRLVAVFAADVEGYSRLMGADEVGTLKGLTERRAILDRFIGDHGGRIANTAGDSVLAEFGSAVDAVQCAVEAQTALDGFAIDPEFERKEAVRLVRLAVSLDDGDPEILARAALTLAYMVGDSESGIEMADRAVALNPNLFAAWNGRGQVYRIAGLPEEAVRSFERAMRVNPVDPRLHLTFGGMAQTFIELRRFDEALAVGKKAHRYNPSYSTAYRCLASAFAHLGRDAEAREAAAQLLEVDPAFTISGWIARGGQTNAKLLIEGLRKAGLPE